MLDVFLLYLQLLLTISIRVWIVGVALFFAGSTLAQMYKPVQGDTWRTLGRLAGFSLMWPLALPTWMLIAWPLTFIAYPAWMFYWFIIMPLHRSFHDRPLWKPNTPDTVQA